MSKEYDSSWLYKKHTNRRSGREFVQVRLRRGISLPDRVVALSEAFDTDQEKLQKLTEDIVQFLSQPEGRRIDEGGSHHDTIKSPFLIFESRARNTGISKEHAHNLVLATVNHLAKETANDSESWWRIRTNLLETLYGIIE